MAAARALENLACSGEGARFEQELKRNPYNLKTWYAYLAALKESSFGERRLVYERALRLVPRSYKLWARYLEELSGATRARFVSSGRATILARTYERALVHLHKMPRIWLDYTALLRSQRLGTATRSAFDRALSQDTPAPLFVCCLGKSARARAGFLFATFFCFFARALAGFFVVRQWRHHV